MKFTAPYCVNHMFRFLASSRHFPITFPSLSSNFRGPGLVVNWLEDQRCNLHYIDQPIYFPSWLPSLDCRMRHEVSNLQSIHSLFDCQSGTKCRCCAIFAIPSMTILIAEDEARSAESGLAILFSCSFSHIFLNLSAFSTFFLPIGGRPLKWNFSFLSYI